MDNKPRVCVDEANGIAGTEHPIGTAMCPVNNLADAHAIASVRLSDEDVAYWKRYYVTNPPDVTAEDILDIIRKKHAKIRAYERAMKVVK